MKKITRVLPWILTFTCTILFFAACNKDDGSERTKKLISITTPLYRSKAAVFAAVNGSASRPIVHAGKLYIKGNYIYLNELNEGIHIIDNSNPYRPSQIAFLSIPGNLDIAIKDNMLYADMYGDLVTFDISNPRNAKVKNVLNYFFTGRASINGYAASTANEVAVSWQKKDTLVYEDQYPVGCIFCEFNTLPAATMNSSSGSTGVAGSMAGMVLMNDHLYAISERHSLSIVDISNAAAPKLDSSFFAGFDLQTVFPFDGKLFLGSAVGMFIYDVTNPAQPVKLGEFAHGRACDPVITDGTYAYVTLHAGDGCGGDANELHVIDVRDLMNATLLKTYSMTKPKGLTKDGNLLFICDSTDVKIYNAANPGDLQLLGSITSKSPYDIIAANNKAMVVCSDGLYQYDYTNIHSIRQLSFLPTKK